MTAAHDDQRNGGVLSALSNAVVTLHKEQFGRGPTRARAHFAGDDTLVRESRTALQAATGERSWTPSRRS
jgi:hypothetical protein